MLRPVRTLTAWAVHLYTASSAVFGLWAVHAIFEHEFNLAIYLLLLTLAIDSTDGALARAIDVKGRIPNVDGRRLDDICDYFTYVLVPACFMAEANLLPHAAWVAVPVLASAYGFSQQSAKTPDHFFLGFPSYWNLVAIYLYLLQIPPENGLWIVLGFSAAVFLPLRFIYPSQTRFLRPLSLAVLGVWLLGFSWVGVHGGSDPLWVRVSLAGPAYYMGLSAFLNLRRPPTNRRAAGGGA